MYFKCIYILNISECIYILNISECYQYKLLTMYLKSKPFVI